MGTAKIISLQAKPTQTTLLCFEVDGILGEARAQLGDKTVAFDFNAFYATLSSAPTTGDGSRLQLDPDAIIAATSASKLTSVRYEQRRTALSTAIAARQNAYYSKYANIADVISKITTWYSPAVNTSKPARLAQLSTLANSQASSLKSAYTNDHRLGVVKTTKSTLSSSVHSSTHATMHEDGSQGNASDEWALTANNLEGKHKLPKLIVGDSIAGSFVSGNKSSETMSEGTEHGTSKSEGTTTTTGSQSESQTIANTDYAYRMPYIESEAQNQRAQISLIDQQFAQFMYSQPLPHLATVFQNELATIDNDVIRLQVAFLNCILMSPFAGTVTGVFKNPGDVVRAGEPVMRVENNTSVYLVASLVYRGRIAIGTTVSVTTSLFDGASGSTTITGVVVAARGRAPNDDQWDVVVKCNNLDGSGNEIVPLDYSFDFDDTVVTIN